MGIRKVEKKNVLFSKTIFETASEKSNEDSRKEKASGNETKDSDVREIDYLTPFLPSNLTDISKITKEEAKEARESCLRALRERLLDRFVIIQKRLDEENAQLAKRQAAYQRSRDHVEGADEEFEQFCHEAMFRIQILDQRLQRHEESALIKYADLNQKLRIDPRLLILNES